MESPVQTAAEPDEDITPSSLIFTTSLVSILHTKFLAEFKKKIKKSVSQFFLNLVQMTEWIVRNQETVVQTGEGGWKPETGR